MLYLLDTSVLIEAKNLYYQLHRIPQFWTWILSHASAGNIKIPRAILGEIRLGSRDDPLLEWIATHEAQLELGENAPVQAIIDTLSQGYGFDSSAVTAMSFGDLGADPILVASALSEKPNRCVVTLEKASITPSVLPLPVNRKIPLVCHRLGIPCMDTFGLIRELDFRIPLAN